MLTKSGKKAHNDFVEIFGWKMVLSKVFNFLGMG